ncbi:VWA domain-containing protein [Nakamurella lactea]|uniref:VWA domain-containing protein n=1 Tax=Nakamurella lactea TaxID=459515 RepID=UPI0003F9E93A|nr:VWA domain-containing protein [Nakamurella lactea]
MTLTSPLLLVVGAVLVVALIVGVVLFTRRRREALAGAGISAPTGRRRAIGGWFTLAGLAVLAVAMAGPAASLPVGRSAGTVIVAMDLSNSMAATDVAPSRLAAAQQAATAFINAQPDTVDIGVVGFDQGALSTSLPGPDRAAAVAAVQNLRISGGTSLAAAIVGSLTAITGKTVSLNKDGSLPDLGYWGSATIVLFSDGEDQGQQGSAELAATAAQNAGVHIDTVGVGTAAGGTVQVDGYQLHTALDEQELTMIARTAGGSYHPASSAAELDGVASSIDLRLTVADQQVPLAGAFIGFALLLLGAGAVLTVVRTGRLV